jgi:poly(3-hydroxybutyrate) depolymerase
MQDRSSRIKLLTMLSLLVIATFSHAESALPKAGEWTKNDNSYDMSDVYLYLPQNKKPAVAGKRALMVVLHGCAQSAEADMIDKRSGWEVPAEKYGMIVVTPTVPKTNPAGTRLEAGCWDWFGTSHKRGERDTGLLATMINGLKARPELNIDPNQIYAVGISSGAGVTNILACTYPELIAGYGVHSGPALGSMVLDVLRGPKVTPESIAETVPSTQENKKLSSPPKS